MIDVKGYIAAIVDMRTAFNALRLEVPGKIVDDLLTRFDRVTDPISKQVDELNLRFSQLGQGAKDVTAERDRQVRLQGWTPEHDDQHGDYSLAAAAATYAMGATLDEAERAVMDDCGEKRGTPHRIHSLWPWGWEWWKPKSRRQDLVRAGALILAEIDRLDRAAAKSQA